MAENKIMVSTFVSQVSKPENKMYLAAIFCLWFDIVAIKVVSVANIVNSSMKFKFIHSIALIHRKIIVLFNLLRVPDIPRSEPDAARGSCILALTLLDRRHWKQR